MNKKLLCTIVGISGFVSGMVTAKVLITISLKQYTKESRKRRNSIIDKNDFSVII